MSSLSERSSNVSKVWAQRPRSWAQVSPKLIEELSNAEEKFEQKLDVAKVTPIRAEPLTEAQWRFAMCEDEMASYKLDEGIRAFVKDTLTLKETLRQMRTETGKIWPQD